jgi:hypothetical protein
MKDRDLGYSRREIMKDRNSGYSRTDFMKDRDSGYSRTDFMKDRNSGYSRRDVMKDRDSDKRSLKDNQYLDAESHPAPLASRLRSFSQLTLDLCVQL